MQIRRTTNAVWEETPGPDERERGPVSKSDHIERKLPLKTKVKFVRHVHEDKREKLHVMLLCAKGPHGVGVCGTQRSVLLAICAKSLISLI